VATLQQKVFSRSNVGAFFVNKQLTVSPDETTERARRFNRVVGADYNLASRDNRWNGKAFYHRSITPQEYSNDQALSAALRYSTQQWEVDWAYDYVGEDYRAETGYIRRTGYHLVSPALEYRFYPSSEKLANHGPGLRYRSIFSPRWKQTDQLMQLQYEIGFLDRSNLTFRLNRKFIRLRNPFDPTNATGDSLAAGTACRWNQGEILYQSGPRNLLGYHLAVGHGGYYHGRRTFAEGYINYRFQPYGSMSVNISYNALKFPFPYRDVDFWLMGPKLDLTFTRSLFLTVFWQYNEQIDNVNTNVRFQWRYQPVSDFYLVYTDNYFPQSFRAKNRALVAKLSYWFN
jgi:hypothetical protein